MAAPDLPAKRVQKVRNFGGPQHPRTARSDREAGEARLTFRGHLEWAFAKLGRPKGSKNTAPRRPGGPARWMSSTRVNVDLEDALERLKPPGAHLPGSARAGLIDLYVFLEINNMETSAHARLPLGWQSNSRGKT